MAARVPAGLQTTSQATKLIINAIDALRGKTGSSLKEITNYIALESGISPASALRNVKLAMKKGVDHGVFKKTGGLYQMHNVIDADDLMRMNRRRRSRKGGVPAAGRRRRRRSRKGTKGGRRGRRRRTRGGRRARGGRRRRSGRRASRRRRIVVAHID